MKRVGQTITRGAKNVIGANVEQIRTQRGYSQKQLSEKLEVLGLSICRDSICRIERCTRQVTDYEALMIAAVLGIDMNRLFEGSLERCDSAPDAQPAIDKAGLTL